MAKAMNTENSHLIRILALAIIGFFLLALIPGGEEGAANFTGLDLMGGTRGESRGEDENFRMIVVKNDPQSEEGYWSVYVILEEKQGEIWNKTTRNLTVEVIRYVDAEEQLILKEYNTSGLGFVDLHLPFDLEDGNYTIRGNVDEVEIDWKKDIIAIPLTSRPPHAVAGIREGDQLVKETTVILDRDHKASVILDASGSWDPDDGQTAFINYTWSIGETKVRQTDPMRHWVFTETGDYNITLKAEDPSITYMYSEDWVMVHVEEIAYQPDLHVTIQPSTHDVLIGDKIEITVVIENIGNDDAWGFDVNYYNGKGVFDFDTIGLIPYGLNRTIRFEYTPMAEGQDRIHVLVDPRNDIIEFDEDNNEAYFDLSIHPRPLPEMIIEFLATNGSFEAEKVTFISIILMNTGTVAAENVSTYLYIENMLMVEELFESVGAGERTTIVYSWTPKSEGLYTAHIIVYVGDVIHDNQYIRDIPIDPKPDPNPENPNDIPVVLLIASGGLLFILLGTVGFAGLENTKYRLLGSLVMTPLYTRLKKEDTLNHEVRARVYEHIVSHPGVSYATILEALELKNGTLVHHLRTLEREHYVKSKKDGKFKRFYQWGTKVGERDPRFLTDIQMEIVDIIKGTPGVSQASIANTLHRSRQSINYQIKILADADLIHVIKHGISTRCYEQET